MRHEGCSPGLDGKAEAQARVGFVLGGGGDIQPVSASSHLMVPNQQAENSPKG